MSDSGWALPKIRAALSECAKREAIPVNETNPEDAFILYQRDGSLGVFWAAAHRDDPNNFRFGGMVQP